jgi:hypothetical protein
MVAFRFTVVIVFLLVVRKRANTQCRSASFGHNVPVELVGSPVPECSNCHEPRAGGIFSDDRAVYFCPKCLAYHAEFRRLMAEIDNDRKALSEDDGSGQMITDLTGRGQAGSPV